MTQDQEQQIEKIKQQLDSTYSAVGLMSIKEVAQVLRRSPASIRTTFASTIRRRQGWAQRLLKGKVRMGKSVFIHSRAVAECLLLGDSDE